MVGDTNEDGRFNQLDLVQVLQAGKYNTGQPATFSEGDWNGDGLFDPLDLVTALQTGSYLGSVAAVRGIANASGAVASDEIENLDFIFSRI